MVTIYGKVNVDTTVAVIAESEEEAERIALRSFRDDTEEWLREDGLCDDPVVTHVSQETWDELQYADQKHLLGPRLQ